MSLARLFGIDPTSAAVVRRLSLLLLVTTGAEILVEGVMLSAFLARVGAAALPTALALRALVEVVLSLGIERAVAKLGPRRGMTAVAVFGALVLAGSAASLRSSAGVYVAFVSVSVVARVKTIHFGVLALSELSGPSAARALPLVHAGGRLGGVFAGPLVALSGPSFGADALALAAALVYLVSLVFVERGPELTHPVADHSTRAVPLKDARGLLGAILAGAVALALGRLALSTQSGAVLARAYGEADLNRVLGSYFFVANVIAFLLQALVVGRVLGSGRLTWLNSGWAWLYFGAQAALSFGPPWVALALAARFVESELRNAIRTPVANLLYEAMPPERRGYARTLVIGVAVPAASLVGGLGLGLVSAHPHALSGLGLAAALVIVVSTSLQNRGWSASAAGA